MVLVRLKERLALLKNLSTVHH